MRTPATLGRFLATCAVALETVQVCLLALVALSFARLRSMDGSYSMDPPAWTGWLSLGLSGVAILMTWSQYRCGHLDVYHLRRRRSRPTRPTA